MQAHLPSKSLQAECESLRKAAEVSAADANDAERELETVKAECEKLRKDAERYRWLRADNAYFPEENYIRGGQELDAAIDAAMQEAKL